MEKNINIANAGLEGKFGISVGKTLRDYYGHTSAFVRAATLAAAGCDARMNGCALPVMTTSGRWCRVDRWRNWVFEALKDRREKAARGEGKGTE